MVAYRFSATETARLLAWIASAFRRLLAGRRALVAENLALRSQLAAVGAEIESGKRRRPALPPWFRAIWVLLCRCWRGWRSCLLLVEPETVVRWHRAGFRVMWRRRSGRVGRPPIEANMARRIRRMARENPTWGGRRIADELRMLGFTPPDPDTIRKYMASAHPSQPDPDRQAKWLAFLRNHMHEAWAMDLCVVPTLTLKPLYVFVVLDHARHTVVHFNVTAAPTAAWVAQQLREATGWVVAPRFLHCDNDPVFQGEAAAFLEAIGVRKVPTMPRSPWQNPFVERFFRTLRRELLDHVIPFNEDHLLRLLNEYTDFYNRHRPHQALGGEPPEPGSTRQLDSPPENRDDELIAFPVCGGIHHVYRRKAA